MFLLGLSAVNFWLTFLFLAAKSSPEVSGDWIVRRLDLDIVRKQDMIWMI